MNETTLPLVELTREIEASPETVWRILTTPALFSTWMDGLISFEPRAGSPFRAEFPKFETVVAGEIVTFDAEERHLGLSWGVESGPQAAGFPAGCSLVEFRVEAQGKGCRVELRHSRFPTEELAKQHSGGWLFHLSRMALQANRTDLEEALETSLAGWFSAWNERDAERRRATLAGCCAEDVEFRDEWTAARGAELLGTHIGNCFIYMPEWKLEPTGDVRICRGEALVGWKGVGPGGAAIEGYSHVRADPDGMLRRVTGFSRSFA